MIFPEEELPMGKNIFFPPSPIPLIPPTFAIEWKLKLSEYTPPNFIEILGCRFKDNFHVPSKFLGE